MLKSKRPVVLIVEDEFLLRMDAVDMIAAAGFEVVEAANADEAIGILAARRDITVVFTNIQTPGSMDGLSSLGRSGTLAADQDCRDLRPRRDCGNRSARRLKVSTETLQSDRCCGRTARRDGRRLDNRTVIPGWSEEQDHRCAMAHLWS